MAAALFTQLEKEGCYTPKGPETAQESKAEQIKHALYAVYQKASQVALLCRKSEDEISWLQEPSHVLDESNVMVMGSGGHQSYVEAVQASNDFQVVFGGVVKNVGNSDGGNQSIRMVFLSKSIILLGPFAVAESETGAEL
jgi:hypothetical protein